MHIICIAAKLSLVAVKGLCQISSADHENECRNYIILCITFTWNFLYAFMTLTQHINVSDGEGPSDFQWTENMEIKQASSLHGMNIFSTSCRVLDA